jgi:hypothetical protein
MAAEIVIFHIARALLLANSLGSATDYCVASPSGRDVYSLTIVLNFKAL